ncbi:hypothetical protein [Mycobacterium sp. TY813]|uniref:hypothetical protein n=1 Tax=Mycobacterium TaxID=1763 RepID=UPI002741A006|nr:hypothetical protein [Mycobacterium sp. TY813]MDP7731500.1 hypothetical protein [Mycobacterium sp. TY813]
MSTLDQITCAPWCIDGDGHPGHHARSDQSCWGPSHKTVFGLEDDAPGLPLETDCGAPGISVHAYQGWYQLPTVRLNVYSAQGKIDRDFLLTPFEAVELAEHLITAVETIGGAR